MKDPIKPSTSAAFSRIGRKSSVPRISTVSGAASIVATNSEL
jgi:hypothetical protein